MLVNRLRIYTQLGGWPGILRFGVILPIKAKFVWRIRCRACGVRRAAWRMKPHWQPMKIPGVVGHHGGSLCRPCHTKACGRRHRGAACTTDVAVA